ncbi:MAG TPA: hypothetical protein VGR35_09190 [Tepidisphaeraceae bacterium]|nr:hypothetical protein [Tepidisphaeraceae bacterium]
MSYALRLVNDAVAQLRTLDAGLQEDVLDELDAVAAVPSRLRVDALGEAVHDFDAMSLRCGTLFSFGFTATT